MSAVETPELQSWIDQRGIEDLIYRYSDAVTRADWDQLDSVFTEASILEIGSPFDLRYEGVQAIHGLLSGSSQLEFLIQTASSPVIRIVGPGRAQATTTIHEMVRGLSGAATGLGEAGAPTNIDQYGVYFDDIVKVDGDWKFAHRVFRPIYIESDSLTGSVITARAGLAAR
jgi:hypothetical protein